MLNLILGLTFTFVISPYLVNSDVTLLDPDGYGALGKTLYETGHFDTIGRAPLYPVFVAFISYIVGGYKIWAIQIAQSILAASTCVVLYKIFKHTLAAYPACWAGLACAIYPMLVWYVPRLLTETFLTFILAVFTLTLIHLLQQGPTLQRTLLCGLMAGVITLSKGIGLIFVLLTPLVLLLYLGKNAWRWVLLFLLCAILLIAPWTWRNWLLTHQFLPVQAYSGYNFYLGNGFVRHWLQAPFSYTALKAYTEQDIQLVYTALPHAPPDDSDLLSIDRILLNAAINDMQAKPLLIFQKLGIQSLTFWYLAADMPKSILTGLIQIPVVLAALPGIIQSTRHRSQALLLMIPVVGIMGVSVVVFAFARLSATIMPYLIALAVYGLWPDRTRTTST